MLAISLLGGCSLGTQDLDNDKGFVATVLEISPDAATGPDFVEPGSIDSADDVDYFELRIRRDLASVIVMTRGSTDTAGSLQTGDRERITAECEGYEPAGPCIFSYDPDTAHNERRTAAFNSMESSGNFVWEGKLPGPDGDEEYRSYFIRVAGENGSTGDYEVTVELNEGQGPMYS